MTANVLPLSDAYQQKADDDIEDITKKLQAIARGLKTSRYRLTSLKVRCEESKQLVDELLDILED